MRVHTCATEIQKKQRCIKDLPFMATIGPFQHTWCIYSRHILLLQSTIPAWQERHRSRRGLGQYQVDGQRFGGAICRDWWAIWLFFRERDLGLVDVLVKNRYKCPLKKRIVWFIDQTSVTLWRVRELLVETVNCLNVPWNLAKFSGRSP